MSVAPFISAETHQFGRTSKARLRNWSEDTGWLSIFASVQTESRTEGLFKAVKDHLLVVPTKDCLRFIGRIGDISGHKYVSPGSVTFTPGGADLRVSVDSEQGDYETVYIYIRRELVEEIAGELSEKDGEVGLVPCIGVIDPVIRVLAIEIREMLGAPSPLDSFYIESLSRVLAARLVRNNAVAGRFQPRLPDQLSPRQLNRAYEYIECHIGDKLGLGDIAKAIGINKGRLTRGFKHNTRMTPYEYVMRTRVERARQMLALTTLPLAEIAAKCGFSDQQHMTRLMRRVTGLTPGLVRQSNDPRLSRRQPEDWPMGVSEG